MNSEDNLNSCNCTKSSFWVCAGLLAVMLISLSSRDITRPFQGLHSWSEASIAWRSKCYLKYPVSYTKMLSTWAVGQPPKPEKPTHYLDHPQLGMLLRTADMIVFGVNEWAQRVGSIIRSLFCLFMFMAILRRLADDRTALLSGLLFVLFPLTQYFPVRDWCFPLSFLLFWYYFIVIGAFRDGPDCRKKHLWGLALTLFFIIQMSWSGFFYAMTIGIHYVFHCLYKKQMPTKTLLAILIIAPFSSMAVNFLIMAAGHGWDFGSIVELYKWRAGSGEMPEHIWSAWFVRFWDYAKLNFTFPILIVGILYLTFGQLLVFRQPRPDGKNRLRPGQFPHMWLFLMPGVFQLFLLKGTLWQHQYWERPLAPFVAMAAALGVIVIYDFLKRANRFAVPFAAIIIVIFVSYCAMGTSYYYNVRWQPSVKINMFKTLNEEISQDKGLLSFEDFIVEQHKVKGAFYRPEIAWYLDREIVPARSIEEIDKYAQSGQFPYYLMPYGHPDQKVNAYLQGLIGALQKKYKVFKFVNGEPGERTSDGKFLRAGMNPYIIFDLQSPPSPNP